MTDTGFLLAELSPTETLEVLARLGEQLGPLWQRGLKVLELAEGPLGTYAGIYEPQSADPGPAQRHLREILAEMAPHAEPRPHRLGRERSLAIDAALLWLLLASSGGDDGARAAEGEWLLVANDLDPEQAAKLSEDLRFHATAVYLAPCTIGRKGQRLYLFHVRADSRRKSSFLGYFAGRGAQGTQMLAAYPSQESLIFLPADRAPSRRALGAFHRALLANPQLFKARQITADAKGRLLAIVPPLPGARPTAIVLLLGLVGFVDHTAVAPSPAPLLDFEVHQLEAGHRALEALRCAVAGAQPYVGYRPELRKTRRTEGSDREIRRLEEQIADLNHRLNYARSLRRSQPVLLRFGERQIPALADALRSFRFSALLDGRLRYGFQASQDRPGGWHFLLWDPSEAAMVEPYPPWRWLGLGGDTRFFWLDPLWAEYYLDHTPASLLFVPRGLGLFPTLHAWEPGDMDRELRRTVAQWFPANRGFLDKLAEPIYIFDGEPSPQARIRIHVLDRKAFRPLTQRIGWINDHLILHRALGGIESYITALASRVSQRQLAERMKAECNASHDAFVRAAEQANQAIASGTSELLSAITSEIDAIASRCRQGEERITKMLAAMAEIDGALKRVEADTEEVDGALGTASELTAERLRIIEDMADRLRQAAEERTRAASQAAGEVDKLRQSEERLRQLLRDSLGFGRSDD